MSWGMWIEKWVGGVGRVEMEERKTGGLGDGRG